MTEQLVRVPAKFYDDHDERGCEPFCNPVKRSSRFVWLRLDDEGLDELLDDAKHYADVDHWGEWGSENRSECRSAAATVKAIETARKAGGAA
jgi:phenylpropionate dioxygenase-like ring-hydroxylating dioxygenase large terminal subunit